MNVGKAEESPKIFGSSLGIGTLCGVWPWSVKTLVYMNISGPIASMNAVAPLTGINKLGNGGARDIKVRRDFEQASVTHNLQFAIGNAPCLLACPVPTE